MTRFLITGGAGFIGSHLSEALLAGGHEVFALDDLSTGSIDNVEHLKKNPKYHYIVESLFNEPVTAELIDKCDVVFHLAAAVGVMLIVESPVRTIETNIGGTEIVLKHAVKKKRLTVIASTSEVYGKATKIPFNEEDDLVLGATTKGRWSYACSKAVDEFLALAYTKEKGLPTIVTRFFNTVGPRQTGRYGMVIPRFVQQALMGEPITVFGDGKQSRCFGYVGDVVQGLIKLVHEPKAIGQVFNVGSDEEITIEQLAEKVRAKANPSVKIKKIPYSEAYEQGFEDMQRRVPDLTKIKKLVGYTHPTTVDEILDKVIDYHKGLTRIRRKPT